MNKKASTGLAIVSVISFLIIGFMMVNFVFNDVDTARGLLSCSSVETISDGTKLVCLMVDLVAPYWIWIILAGGIGYLIARLL